jgi:hypothetical protein
MHSGKLCLLNKGNMYKACSQNETACISRENVKLIGNLGGRFGDIAKLMVAPKLADKFNELGFFFEKIHRNTIR